MTHLGERRVAVFTGPAVELRPIRPDRAAWCDDVLEGEVR